MDNPILLDITIRSLPPSVNGLYATVKGRRVKSEVGRDFVKLVVDCIQLENRGFTIPFGSELEFFLVCFYPFKMGKHSKDPLLNSDSDNTLKIAKDSVFAASMLDLKTKQMAKDNQVQADHTRKLRGNPQTLELYPRGYSRMVLAYTGHTFEILKMLEANQQ